MKKKILSLLVTMGLAASLVPVSVFADGTEVWDGSVAESRIPFNEIASSKFERHNCIKDEKRCGCNIW